MQRARGLVESGRMAAVPALVVAEEQWSVVVEGFVEDRIHPPEDGLKEDEVQVIAGMMVARTNLKVGSG